MTLRGLLHQLVRRHHVVTRFREVQQRPTDECTDCGRVWTA